VTQTVTITRTSRRAGRARIAHAEDPGRPGLALCGATLGGSLVSATTHRCIVCLELARPTFVLR
jgi:hypothetical protein